MCRRDGRPIRDGSLPHQPMKSWFLRPCAALVFVATLLAARADESDLENLQTRAEAGDAAAMAALAEHYRDEVGGEEQAVRWYRRAAERGQADAQLELGIILRDGRGTTADPEEAFQWLLKAAEQGRPYAMTLVAASYAEGEVVKKNLVQALRWYRAAAEKGDSQAAFDAGAMLADGRGTKRDPVEATKWLTVAAQADISAAREKLAQLAADETKQSAAPPAAAAEEIRRLEAAVARGDTAAMLSLAERYEKGAGVRQSELLASQLRYRARHSSVFSGKDLPELKTAKAAAPAPAAPADAPKTADDFYGACQIMSHLSLSTTKTDKERAAMWDDALESLKRAVAIAETGNPETKYRLALVLAQGALGIPKDEVRARVLLTAASDAGFAQARLDHAQALLTGALGFTADAKRGLALLLSVVDKAEEQHPETKHFVAMILFQGAYGVPADRARAIRLLEDAAKWGVPASQIELGRALLAGVPPELPADPARGIELLKRCANQGVPQAMALLGEIYERGVGTAADPAEAQRWYASAVNAGFRAAEAGRDRMAAKVRGAAKH